jgi:D-alanine-D-alanine ligase
MKSLKVLCLTHEDFVPPARASERKDFHDEQWRTEQYVFATLAKLGHEARMLGVRYDLGVLRTALEEFKPDIVFNLLEEFHDQPIYDQNLELMQVPYTGCNPRGMVLARDKALTRKVLSYHRIPGPEFVVFAKGKKIKRPKKLSMPLFVKSQIEEASLGISQASVVQSDAELEERVRFMHEKVNTDVIVEEYIEGRELYVGILGAERLVVLPIWELVFENMPDNVPHIATRRVKWDPKYQKKRGIVSREAHGLSPELRQRIQSVCKRTYRALGLSGYARIDLRLRADGEIYVIEANPNPEIAFQEDFADSAKKQGYSYEDLIQRVLALGLRGR